MWVTQQDGSSVSGEAVAGSEGADAAKHPPPKSLDEVRSQRHAHPRSHPRRASERPTRAARPDPSDNRRAPRPPASGGRPLSARVRHSPLSAAGRRARAGGPR